MARFLEYIYTGETPEGLPVQQLGELVFLGNQCLGFEVRVLGFGVQGFGFWECSFWDWGLGLGVWDWGLEPRV